jgi:AN1-type zinc finger and ubiquitin domain-containing protein 1
MKCYNCSKKVKLIHQYLYSCKCEKVFCSDCFPSFNHNCKFDYKSENKKILREDNEQILPEKIIKI